MVCAQTVDELKSAAVVAYASELPVFPMPESIWSYEQMADKVHEIAEQLGLGKPSFREVDYAALEAEIRRKAGWDTDLTEAEIEEIVQVELALAKGYLNADCDGVNILVYNAGSVLIEIGATVERAANRAQAAAVSEQLLQRYQDVLPYSAPEWSAVEFTGRQGAEETVWSFKVWQNGDTFGPWMNYTSFLVENDRLTLIAIRYHEDEPMGYYPTITPEQAKAKFARHEFSTLVPEEYFPADMSPAAVELIYLPFYDAKCLVPVYQITARLSDDTPLFSTGDDAKSYGYFIVPAIASAYVEMI